MAVAVVDLFEAVDVDEGEGEGAAGAVGSFEFAFDLFESEAAGACAGQLVGCCLLDGFCGLGANQEGFGAFAGCPAAVGGCLGAVGGGARPVAGG